MPPGSNPIPNHVLNRRRNDTTDVQTVGGDDPAAATLAAITTRPEDEAELLETESNTVASFPDYRRKVAEMIKWWKEHYNEAYEVLVFELSDTERNDKRLHYLGATHDLRYDLLEPRWMQIFMSGAKKWKDEAKTIQYAYDTPRKYHDAILKCAGVSKYKLPTTPSSVHPTRMHWVTFV